MTDLSQVQDELDRFCDVVNSEGIWTNPSTRTSIWSQDCEAFLNFSVKIPDTSWDVGTVSERFIYNPRKPGDFERALAEAWRWFRALETPQERRRKDLLASLSNVIEGFRESDVPEEVLAPLAAVFATFKTNLLSAPHPEPEDTATIEEKS